MADPREAKVTDDAVRAKRFRAAIGAINAALDDIDEATAAVRAALARSLDREDTP